MRQIPICRLSLAPHCGKQKVKKKELEQSTITIPWALNKSIEEPRYYFHFMEIFIDMLSMVAIITIVRNEWRSIRGKNKMRKK